MCVFSQTEETVSEILTCHVCLCYVFPQKCPRTVPEVYGTTPEEFWTNSGSLWTILDQSRLKIVISANKTYQSKHDFKYVDISLAPKDPCPTSTCLILLSRAATPYWERKVLLLPMRIKKKQSYILGHSLNSRGSSGV